MTLRILHLIASLGTGGAERQVSLLLPLMQRNGTSASLCYHTDGPNSDALIAGDVPLHRLPPRASHDPRLLTDIRYIVAQVKPHIIQTWLPQMDILGGLVAHWMGVPHILSERSSAGMYAKGGWKNRFRVAIGKSARAIIANSDSGLDYWRSQGAQTQLHVVRNALTPPSTEPAPLAQMGLEGRPLLIAAGRLSHEKNVAVLVKAIAGALLKLPEHHGVIFGEGPEREDTLALIEATGLSGRLHLGGHTSNLSGWLRAADVFISASLMEGHPNVVIEAAAAGCPLVLSDIPAHREFAVGDSALFAPAAHPGLLAAAMVQSVEARGQALIRAARAQALTLPLSAQTAAQRYIDIYRSLLTETPHS
ncbi:glycosyltransferase [Limnobacter sp.]|uniref:glycosyltransferase n=1 Tax=Limnobacter sp. TaxID=2003368 RepID=UPI0035136384